MVTKHSARLSCVCAGVSPELDELREQYQCLPDFLTQLVLPTRTGAMLHCCFNVLPVTTTSSTCTRLSRPI